ncbi:DUF6879 family protein [Sinosporangium siamense]|uniref:DUF6879 domain-containing protein n=1 Tax=Sinosporangium siamense TaxID=1367973 RepID=A0A919V7D5_9ACTN|nr:DUF6879 family protein [Sinosporangium siamense]GII92971.1 hypothetical protein Ssi02_32020 [Sinosporangium siamense]
MPNQTWITLDPSAGRRLARDAYHADFRHYRGIIRDSNSWKLERRQHFEEIGSPSRDALRRGEWEESLAYLEELREGFLRGVLKDRENNTAFHRLRIVEEPLTPYIQWELHSLRIEAECGKPIRVVNARTLGSLEEPGPLPEIVILGQAALYQVHYTESGVPDGATAFYDRDVIRSWTELIQQLYEAGEGVIEYFNNHVARLPPPPKA